MTKNWKIAEKTIGVFFLILGTSLMMFHSWLADFYYNEVVLKFGYSWKDLSILKMVGNFYDYILFPMFYIFTGIALLLSKKIGWVLGVVLSSFYGISIVLSLCVKVDLKENELIVFGWMMGVIFIIIAILLLAKPFRNKYQPTQRTWLIMGVLWVFLLVHYFWF